MFTKYFRFCARPQSTRIMLKVVLEEEIPSGNIILLELSWEPEVMQRSDYAKNSRWVGQKKESKHVKWKFSKDIKNQNIRKEVSGQLKR